MQAAGVEAGKGKSGWYLGSWGKALWSAELEMRGYRAVIVKKEAVEEGG